VDRLDAWLNSQAGLLRVMLVWLLLCPLAVGLGTSSFDLFTLGVPRPGIVFVLVAALSVVTAIPVAGLVVAAQRKRQELRRRQGQNSGPPLFSWRMGVAMWCVAAGVLLGTLIDQQPHGRGSALVIWLVQLALLAGAVVFWLLEVRRKQLSDGKTPGGQGQ
jgi:L-asparagine transporter-like permease